MASTNISICSTSSLAHNIHIITLKYIPAPLEEYMYCCEIIHVPNDNVAYKTVF